MPINQPQITPGQGLLLLIQHCQEDSKKVEKLKKLYLMGANNGERCIELCDLLLNEPLMKKYDIAINEESINADPTRRYFETHLAYQTLVHQLKLVGLDELMSLFESSAELVNPNISEGKLQTILNVIEGTCVRPAFKKRENYQFNSYIRKLKDGSIFSKLNETEREKIKWLERILYMALVNGWRSTKMPIDIYHGERFSYPARGKIMRDVEDLRTTRNQSFGLLKGHMPLSADDIARANEPFDHMKSGDYATFNPDSPVVQTCFQQFVHPFSNSVSGCFLVHLRVLARLHLDENGFDFTESLDKFLLLMRLTLSSSLFYSGGHSLYEYISVLNDPEVQEFFQYMPGFSDLDLDKLFYQANEDAFNKALQATVNYNHHLLKKMSIHMELTSPLTFFKNDKKNSSIQHVSSISDFTDAEIITNSSYSSPSSTPWLA